MTVSIIVVALNAEIYINGLFDCILKQTYDLKKMEIILVDGHSDDKTYEIMRNFLKNHQNKFYDIKIFENCHKNLPAGTNIALSNAIGDCIIRLDAHLKIPNDFIEKNVLNMQRGEYITGGRVSNFVTKDTTKSSKIALLTENSMFGGSIANFRRKNVSGYVRNLAFPMYRREVFENVGGYDVRLLRTEDNEMHFRMYEKGYKFYFSSDINSTREARSSFFKLLKQKIQNGMWVGITACENLRIFSLYHFAPLFFVLGLISFSFLAFAGYSQLLNFYVALYAFFITIVVCLEFFVKKCRLVSLFLIVTIPILHICYGMATFCGFVKFVFWSGRNRKSEEIYSVLAKMQEKSEVIS